MAVIGSEGKISQILSDSMKSPVMFSRNVFVGGICVSKLLKLFKPVRKALTIFRK